EDNLYNPLQYRFSEIKDSTPPTVSAFALKTMSIDARVNGKFGWIEFRPDEKGKVYTLPDTITANGLLGLEVQAFDRLDDADNKNGNQQMVVLVNNKQHFSYLLDKVPFEKSRQVSWHINYEVAKKYNRNFQKCYVDDGNYLPIYNAGPSKGKLLILPDQYYNVQVDVVDSYQNVSSIKFVIKGQKPAYLYSINERVKKPDLSYDVNDNFLKVFATDTARSPRNIVVYRGHTKFDLLPSYTQNSTSTYLYDLRAGVPDSMHFCGITEKFNFRHIIPSETEFSFYSLPMDIVFGKNSLFDTLFLQTDYTDGIYTIQDVLTPIYRPIKVTLRTDAEIADKSKYHVYNLGTGRGRAFEGGTWDGNAITFFTRSFGKYAILPDTTEPKIRLLSKSSKQIRFSIRDDLSGINSFRAEVDGKWLLLHYEHKSALLYSEKLDKTLPLSGEVILKVTDNAGNEAIYKTKI
ncbi:MAG: M23 family peptidase, partial [Hymenobacteraceae bacterium]|nr:M23 family peptidase [Hymenobacteraceae bacterium]